MDNETNVLLTTLSRSGLNTISYYYCDQGDFGYVNGLSQQEFGTKFILSQNRIDKIVVIASAETSDKEYKHYEEAIKCYIDNVDFEKIKEIAYSNIVPKERREAFRLAIEALVRKAICDSSIVSGVNEGDIDFEYFVRQMIIQKKENVFIDLLRSRINDLINADYVNETGFVQYITESQSLRDKYEELGLSKRRLDDEGKRIFDDKWVESLSIIEKEYLFVCLREKIRENEFQRKLLYSETEINELKAEINWLNYQIVNLQSDRVRKTLEYAKYYIFNSLSETAYLKSLSCNANIPFQMVLDRKIEKDQEIDNIIEITNAIKGKGDLKVNLYIDIQGGFRTSQYVRNAVIGMLNEDAGTLNGVVIKNMIASEFDQRNWFSRIVDEKQRYMISDFVSAMSAFINFGKAGLLKKYYDSLESENHRVLIGNVLSVLKQNIRDDFGEMLKIGECEKLESYSDSKLMDTIQNIDSSIATCNMDTLVANIKKVKNLLTEGEVVSTDIRGKSFLLELIKWCYRKEFYQQALTLIESNMPDEFVQKGVIYYCKGEDEKTKIFNQWVEYYSNHKRDYKFDKLNHYFIKYYIVPIIENCPYINKIKDYNQGPLYKIIKRNIDNNKYNNRDVVKRLVITGKFFDAINCKDNRRVKPSVNMHYFCEDDLEDNNLENLVCLIYRYLEVSEIRNDTNHAQGKYSINDVRSAIEGFIKAYDNILNSIAVKHNYSVVLSADDVMSVIDKICKVKVIGHNDSGAFAIAKTNSGKTVRFWDNNTCDKGTIVRVRFKGIEKGYEQWERVE